MPGKAPTDSSRCWFRSGTSQGDGSAGGTETPKVAAAVPDPSGYSRALRVVFLIPTLEPIAQGLGSQVQCARPKVLGCGTRWDKAGRMRDTTQGFG